MALLFALLLIFAQAITAALFHAIQEEPHVEHAASLIKGYAMALDLTLSNIPSNHVSETLDTFSNQLGLSVVL